MLGVVHRNCHSVSLRPRRHRFLHHLVESPFVWGLKPNRFRASLLNQFGQHLHHGARGVCA